MSPDVTIHVHEMASRSSLHHCTHADEDNLNEARRTPCPWNRALPNTNDEAATRLGQEHKKLAIWTTHAY